MPTFTYKGINAEGRRVCGSCSYPTQALAEEYLQKRELTGISVFASKTKYSSGLYSVVAPKELSIFCREMSVMFFSHITLMEGLQLLREQSENKQLKVAIGEVYDHMGAGFTFAEAMGMYDHIFSAYLLNMITIGETSGTLDSVFSRMAEYFDKEYRIRKKLKAAVTYPLLLTVLMGAILVLLIIRILPMFERTLSSMGGEMPLATNIIFAVANFLGSYALIILIAIAAVVFLYVLYVRTDKGRMWLDKTKLSFPVSRFIQTRILTARFSRSLAILLKSGVQLLNAMEDITVLMDNKHLEIKFAAALRQIKEGRNLPEVLGEIGIFPPLFLKLVTVGNTTGHLDEMLDRSAGILDEEVDDAVERITVTIEPALIIVLSVVVGVILLSVMLPMISIMNAIG